MFVIKTPGPKKCIGTNAETSLENNSVPLRSDWVVNEPNIVGWTEIISAHV